MHPIKVEQFEGPLDLLLQLIEESKLDITTVALADVTDQYLEAIHARTVWDPEELADFLVVAAKLVLIKSKTLLPMLDFGEEEAEAATLEAQLRMYKEYLEASRTIDRLLQQKHFLFTREKVMLREPFFSPPESLTASTLATIFEHVLQTIKPFLSVPRSIIERTISIQEKIAHIRQVILDVVSVNFHHVVRNAKNKTEIIVTFLAVLELVKQRMVDVMQLEHFGDFTIRKIS